MKYDVLYHFSHGPLHLVETKRLDLPSSASPGEIYQWFFVDDQKVQPLTFTSMSIAPQSRVFEEGTVAFDLNSCLGTLFGKNIELTRNDKVSNSLGALLEEALRMKGRE